MKTLLFTLLLCFSVAMHAQKDVTKFLGIPVDGSKAEMMQKLEEKGFSKLTDKQLNNMLEGEFNGHDVYVSIVTNNNKVWRIGLMDKNLVGERDIQIRFNRLCEQFKNNSNYITFQADPIPDDEDISYETTVNNKRYEAIFYQTTIMDSTAIVQQIQSFIKNKYTQEQIDNPTEEIKQEVFKEATLYTIEIAKNKPVWFMVSNSYGKYYISMFYDNEYNHANGEDL